MISELTTPIGHLQLHHEGNADKLMALHVLQDKAENMATATMHQLQQARRPTKPTAAGAAQDVGYTQQL